MVQIRNRNCNRNLSKVGTGTVKNSYGSTTLKLLKYHEFCHQQNLVELQAGRT
jgi:hypothetical protein